MVVAIAQLALLLCNDQSQMINTPLYVAQLALYNVYVYLVAFLYAPNLQDHTEYQGAMKELSAIFG